MSVSEISDQLTAVKEYLVMLSLFFLLLFKQQNLFIITRFQVQGIPWNKATNLQNLHKQSQLKQANQAQTRANKACHANKKQKQVTTARKRVPADWLLLGPDTSFQNKQKSNNSPKKTTAREQMINPCP